MPFEQRETLLSLSCWQWDQWLIDKRAAEKGNILPMSWRSLQSPLWLLMSHLLTKSSLILLRNRWDASICRQIDIYSPVCEEAVNQHHVSWFTWEWPLRAHCECRWLCQRATWVALCYLCEVAGRLNGVWLFFKKLLNVWGPQTHSF